MRQVLPLSAFCQNKRSLNTEESDSDGHGNLQTEAVVADSCTRKMDCSNAAAAFANRKQTKSEPWSPQKFRDLTGK
jgi:hypothetical protein